MRYGVFVTRYTDKPCGCGGLIKEVTLMALHDVELRAQNDAWMLRDEGMSAIVGEHEDLLWLVGETRESPC